MNRTKSAVRAAAVALVYAYIWNNAYHVPNRIPDAIWWMFPEYVWFHLNSGFVFVLACLIAVGIPAFLFFRLVEAITQAVKR